MDTNEKIIAIIGITEAIKQYGIPSQFCPTIAIIVGGLFGYAEKQNSQGMLEGVLLGATCTGSYALTKRVGRGALSPFRRPPDFRAQEHDDDRGL